MTDGFQLFYASRTVMRITRVTFETEAELREWFGKVRSWNDVIRVRAVDPDGNVMADQVVEHRLEVPEDADREDKIRELADRMDAPTFVPDRTFVKKPPSAPAPTSKLTVNAASSEVCACGHTRVEHNGADSSGYCHAQCTARCKRFRRRP